MHHQYCWLRTPYHCAWRCWVASLLWTQRPHLPRWPPSETCTTPPTARAGRTAGTGWGRETRARALVDGPTSAALSAVMSCTCTHAPRHEGAGPYQIPRSNVCLDDGEDARARMHAHLQCVAVPSVYAVGPSIHAVDPSCACCSMLDLGANNLVGTIPTSLSALTALAYVQPCMPHSIEALLFVRASVRGVSGSFWWLTPCLLCLVCLCILMGFEIVSLKCSVQRLRPALRQVPGDVKQHHPGSASVQLLP